MNKLNWDGLGIATSLACAIHCAVLPMILTSLPLCGINIIHNIFFEWMMIAIAFMVGAFSLFHGYVKHHRSLVPVIIFSIGFAFLVSKQFFHLYDNILLIPAMICIIAAHYLNYRLCHKTRCASHHHKH
ncbi:MAG TPA: MerC domain-containing protein [Ferruginibacter sp.]|nr:MerC domain-containing protein [Ferruginibacter sp.]